MVHKVLLWKYLIFTFTNSYMINFVQYTSFLIYNNQQR